MLVAIREKGLVATDLYRDHLATKRHFWAVAARGPEFHFVRFQSLFEVFDLGMFGVVLRCHSWVFLRFINIV